MPARFAVIVNGQTTQGPGLPLEDAARRIAEGHRHGDRIEARAAQPGGWRPLSHLETKALAVAAAIELTS